MSDLLDRLQAALADRYRLEVDESGAARVLGRGGMATVYLAQDLRHRRLVALKVLHPDLAQALGAERFLREIEIASQLTHPHILPLHDSGNAEGVLYYVMPHVVGESLRQRLTRQRQLPVEEAIRLAGEIGRALDYAHEHGVIHRDIKPENILLQDGQALVADFGIARAITGSLEAGGAQKLTETGITLGTPAYMSPEQAVGERGLDGRSDLYSLGCVVYEMLAGEPPFTGPSAQAILARHALDPVPRLRTVRSAVPEHTERAVTRALGKVPADRFENAEEFAVALLTPGTLPVFRPSEGHRRLRLSAWRRLTLATIVLVAGAAAAGILFSRNAAPAALDPNLLAVAPFDVVDPKLSLWREGLVDYLTKNLDGAGQLHTVSPAVVLQRWKGRADPGSAQALGRRSGARVVVFGHLGPVGRDSVQVRATVLDVASKGTVAEFEGVDQVDRVDRLADSLTLEVLRGLGRATTGGPVRLTAIGTRSIPALKAYLKGQQAFRRAEYDSADAYFSRAVALDSTFALALHGLATTRGWGNTGETTDLALRAARFNHGLSPRDSLMILADSLRTAATNVGIALDTSYWSHLGRMIGVLEEAGGSNRQDPEVWLTLGDVLFHYDYVVASTGIGRAAEYSAREVRHAFDRSIGLDSTLAAAYLHPIELAGDPVRAHPYIVGYLEAAGPEGHSAGVRTLAKVIDPAAKVARLLDSSSTDELGAMLDLTSTWQDSSEIALRLAPLYVGRPDNGDGPDVPDARPPWFKGYVAERLAYRGHLKAARAALGDRPRVAMEGGQSGDDTFLALVFLGLIPADSAATLPAPSIFDASGAMTIIWWAGQRDTSSLLRYLARVDSLAKRAVHAVCWDPKCEGASSAPWDLASARATPGLVRAALDLARTDTAGALRRLLVLPDSVYADNWKVRLLKFRLLASMRREQEAAQLFDQPVLPPLSPLWIMGTLERARIAERRGERTRAVECYQFVMDVWRHADPELQHYVAEARGALERLARG
jgi:eukaryotic-like serine/threonine-protein kinase